MVVHIDFKMFVDRSKVFSRLAKKERRVLTRVGGTTRLAMKRSMRKARKPKKGDSGGSKTGEPPRYRSKRLRDAIFFGYDEKTKTVVTGPLKFKSPNSVSVPQLLNEGGTVTVTLPGGERERATYLPRPFATADSPAGKVGLKTLIEETKNVPL